MSCPAHGKLLIIPSYIHIRQKIHDTLSGQVTMKHRTMVISYQNELELMEIMEKISNSLTYVEKQKTLVCLMDGQEFWKVLATTRTFQSLYTYLNRKEVVEVLVKKNGLTFALQPIWSLKTNTVHSLEYLMRGQGVEGLIPPYVLLETAQEINVDVSLDQHLRELAIQKSPPFCKEGIKSFINFSPMSIHDPETSVQRITSAIDQSHLRRDDFVFEIVETDRVDDQEHLKQIVKGFRDNGIKVALDDIGAGYSSLLYIVELLPDYVKVDRGIVDGCARDLSKGTLLKSIVGLCKELNIEVVAEGVEQEEDLRFCQELEVDYVQGFLLGRPNLYQEMLKANWSDMEHRIKKYAI